jgi:RimJ/RimL family protein N-acetyltransferase
MILGNGIRLTALDRADLPRFVEWLNDPEVIEGLLIHIPMSAPQEEQWFEKTLSKPLEEQPLSIQIEKEQGWETIGNVGLFDFEWCNRSAEVGIVIGNKQAWNQGHGRKAMQLILRHGFENLNLHRIYLKVYETNPRAIRSYEHAGFKLEGRMRQAQFKNGRYVDVLMMSVLQPEWEKSQGESD